MAWNARFPSVASLSGRKKQPPTEASDLSLSISRWLNVINLSEYAVAFEKFSTIDDVIKYTDRDLDDLGVKNDVHRFQMVSSLIAIKAKYERGPGPGPGPGLDPSPRSDGLPATNVDNSQSQSRSRSRSQRQRQRHRHSLAVEPSMLTNRNSVECTASMEEMLEQSRSWTDVKMDGTGPECDADSTRSKRMLEWELSLDGRDLRSHAWYHGCVSRTAAEQMVAGRDGDFLVRDCSSQPGNYVLTCRSKGQTLHFVINKMILQPDTVYESVQYRFEEDGFDTVADLITYYVGSGKPVTAVSDAKIRAPCNRLQPLSWRERTNADRGPPSPACSPPVHPSRRPSRHRRDSLGSSSPRSVVVPHSTTTTTTTTTVPRLRRFSRSNSVVGPAGAAVADASRTLRSSPSPEYANRAVPVEDAAGPRDADGDEEEEEEQEEQQEEQQQQQQQQQSLTVAEREAEEPPPKPSRRVRQPAAERARNGVAPVPAGGDGGNGCGGDSAHGGVDQSSSSRWTLRRRSSSGVVIKHPKYSAATAAATAEDARNGDGCGGGGGGGPSPSSCSFATSMPQLPSAFEPDNLHTLLLPVAENKPLEVDALRAVHALLVESGSRILANHLTRVDLRLTVANLGPRYVGCMCATGIELATLPHGRQHRTDLIERTECIKLLVATTILTCDTESERAELLNKWIEVAIDAKTALGNLFGFCAIMLGLCTPQVQRLDETWHILRQKFTDSAFNFEAKLRSTLKSMNESTNPAAPNTTIPHLLPVLLLYEHAFDEITGADGARMLGAHSLQATVEQWERSTSDLGLSTWHAHLSGSRHFCRSLPTFRRNAEIVLADSKIDELLLDLFRTEFHLKFLWGSRGANVAAAERHLKFEEILGVMSDKCECPAVADAYS